MIIVLQPAAYKGFFLALKSDTFASQDFNMKLANLGWLTTLTPMTYASITSFCTSKNCGNCQKYIARGMVRENSPEGRVCKMLITRPGCCVHALEQQFGIEF